LLGEHLLSLLVLPLCLEARLLGLVLFLLASGLGGPEIVDGFGLSSHLRSRRRLLDLLGRPTRQSRAVVFFAKQARRVLRKLGDGDKTGQVSQVRTLIVEPNKTVVLGIISATEGLESFVFTGCYTII
jgi:hypothetical protein